MKVQDFQKKYHCQWAPLRGKKPKWIFHNFGHLFKNHLSSYQRRVSEWFQRNGKSGQFLEILFKARVISIQAPRWRQFSLMSDFVDLVNLSMQQEAALATNWINDRPGGLKLQNRALATMTGPAVRSEP